MYNNIKVNAFYISPGTGRKIQVVLTKETKKEEAQSVQKVKIEQKFA